MINWIAANKANLIIGIILLGIVAAIVVNLVKKLRRGGSTCAYCADADCCAHKEGRAETSN
ncbi:MAG: FeoB-associated Cys-rich membrane protein [Spirochaetales bacterium]|jgi:hypothetical protein|nr:FeoB-associated Cys-rich membrane protein [Spirochaetales bacterium]